MSAFFSLAGFLSSRRVLGGSISKVYYLLQKTFVLTTASSTAALATTARAAATTRGGSTRERARGSARRYNTIRAARHLALLVGLLRHLQYVAEALSLVSLHCRLDVSEPLVCHFVY